MEQLMKDVYPLLGSNGLLQAGEYLLDCQGGGRRRRFGVPMMILRIVVLLTVLVAGYGGNFDYARPLKRAFTLHLSCEWSLNKFPKV